MILDISNLETLSVENGMSIWFLGGPSQAIRTVESMLYLDLFTGPSPVPSVTKSIPETIDPSLIRRADIAISTHHDEDHCDENSLTWLHKNTNSIFLGPVSCNRLYHKWEFSLNRMRQIAAYESLRIKDVNIYAYPSNDVFDPDALTYVIETE
jgi:L-ascorbate metabolism protein UlaG (beta-lactamase superfamily)